MSKKPIGQRLREGLTELRDDLKAGKPIPCTTLRRTIVNGKPVVVRVGEVIAPRAARKAKAAKPRKGK